MRTFLIPAIFAASLAAQPPTITSAAPQSPLGAEPSSDAVVATVDGHDVTYGELRSLLSMAPPNVQRNPQLGLQQIFIMKYLAAEGDKIKLGERSPLKEELEFTRMNIIAQAMLNIQRESSAVPEGSVEAYYKANASKYEQAKIKVIYIAFKPGVTGTASTAEDLARAAQEALAQAHAGTDRSEAQAKTLAEEVVKKARGGADFLALVEQYSEDPTSKAAHGDFGVIKHDSTYPDDLKKAVFALENGKISDPVRQPTGFYIIRMDEKSAQPLSEVGGDIVQAVRQEALNTWFQDLNNRFKPVIKDPAAFVQSGASGNIQLPGQPPK
jgi:peptidyl-prolyl cis-trans isomerase C